MFSRIVVGVAKADTAKQAAERAKQLARTFDAEMHVVTAYDARDADAARHAEAMLDSLATAAGIPVETHARQGDPAEVILQVAEEVQADLIVVGNQGMHKRLGGSIPNTVAHHAQCSVLILDTDD